MGYVVKNRIGLGRAPIDLIEGSSPSPVVPSFATPTITPTLMPAHPESVIVPEPRPVHSGGAFDVTAFGKSGGFYRNPVPPVPVPVLPPVPQNSYTSNTGSAVFTTVQEAKLAASRTRRETADLPYGADGRPLTPYAPVTVTAPDGMPSSLSNSPVTGQPIIAASQGNTGIYTGYSADVAARSAANKAAAAAASALPSEVPLVTDVIGSDASPWLKWGLLALGGYVLLDSTGVFGSVRSDRRPSRRRRRVR